MSLRDQACYTLTSRVSATDPSMVELVEVDGSKHEARYARVRERKEGEAYSAAIYDYLTGAKLSSTGHPGDKAKQRRLQLHGPDEDIAFEFSGRVGFEWTFTFQGNKYRWSKEIYGRDYICALDRKPDPKVEICLARSADKTDTARIQILHYNIDRFPDEITDLRGLETLLLTTFMSFVDTSEERLSRPVPTPSPAKTSPVNSSNAVPHASSSTGATATGREEEKVIGEDDYEPESPNEIRVGMRTNLDDHVARAIGLLMDPTVLFVIIRTKEPVAAQRALEVALGVTRFRHREGLGDLHQYVVEQTEERSGPPTPPKGAGASGAKGPKVIKLDDPTPAPLPAKKPSQPATALNIAIYLSTIDLPDLHPSRRNTSAGYQNQASSSASHTPTAAAGPSQPGKVTNRPSQPQPQPQPLAPSATAKPTKPPAQASAPTRPPANSPATTTAARPAAPTPTPTTQPGAPVPPAPATSGYVRYVSRPRPVSPLPPQSVPLSGADPAPTPAPATGGGGKAESVVKKLIAMSRR